MTAEQNRPAQQALIERERQWHSAGTGPWDKDELRRLAQLGGATDELFERGGAGLEDRFRVEQAALDDGTFHAGFGALHYLVSGRKP